MKNFLIFTLCFGLIFSPYTGVKADEREFGTPSEVLYSVCRGFMDKGSSLSKADASLITNVLESVSRVVRKIRAGSPRGESAITDLDVFLRMVRGSLQKGDATGFRILTEEPDMEAYLNSLAASFSLPPHPKRAAAVLAERDRESNTGCLTGCGLILLSGSLVVGGALYTLAYFLGALGKGITGDAGSAFVNFIKAFGGIGVSVIGGFTGLFGFLYGLSSASVTSDQGDFIDFLKRAQEVQNSALQIPSVAYFVVRDPESDDDRPIRHILVKDKGKTVLILYR